MLIEPKIDIIMKFRIKLVGSYNLISDKTTSIIYCVGVSIIIDTVNDHSVYHIAQGCCYSLAN